MKFSVVAGCYIWLPQSWGYTLFPCHFASLLTAYHAGIGYMICCHLEDEILFWTHFKRCLIASSSIRKLLEIYPSNSRLLISPLVCSIQTRALSRYISPWLLQNSQSSLWVNYHACRISGCETSMSMQSGMAMLIGHLQWRRVCLKCPAQQAASGKLLSCSSFE
jgi:hypothetical protein